MTALKLLHVEDDDGDAITVKRACLQEFGSGNFQLKRVDTVAAAIANLHESAYDAVLLDLNLNDMNGMETVTAVRDARPELPIVVVSGQDDTDVALKAVRGGAQEYMVKGHINSRILGLAVRSSIERKAYEYQLFQQANQDELTGLANRRAFLEHMNQWIARADRWDREECIMFLDVNNFKDVNDTLGHEVGDQLLKKIAELLRERLRASDMLARFGGDEFVIHLDAPARKNRENSLQTAEAIEGLFRDPIPVGDHLVKTGVSIGIACYPEHGPDVASLIQRADEAMYCAKQAGLGYAMAAVPKNAAVSELAAKAS